MGFFDKALKKVQDVGENIAASANNVKTVVETSVQDTMEITGLKRQIRELEKEMDAQPAPCTDLILLPADFLRCWTYRFTLLL